MSVVFPRGPGWAVRSSGTLTGEFSYSASGKRAVTRTWRPAQFDPALAAWFTAASDGDRVEIFVDVSADGQPVQVRMANPPLVARPAPDQERLSALERFGGGVNPYTFIPTPPRDGLPPAPPAPHGVVDPATQWSGWLVLRLVARTPLLLPDPEAVTRDAEDHPTYPVRLGADGKPLLHGASVKGALRSAYEMITGSRYAVFRGHERALAYRRPASNEDRPRVTPARVESDGRGGLHFALCSRPALSVPLYDPPAHGQPGKPRRKARAEGQAATLVTTRPDGTADWSALHGREVAYTTREAGQPGKSRTVVDEIRLAGDADPAGTARRGWLSVTGRSIEQKASERLFVPAGQSIPVEEQHHVLWNAVLASYRDAAEYNDPGLDKAGRKLDRSRHVAADGEVPERLAEGDLVYLDTRQPAAGPAGTPGRRAHAGPTVVTAVHPVMIGRLPYPAPPAPRLDKSLQPAATPGEMSPADRLFGWAPQQRRGGRPPASGYRGRVRIESVRCETDDWLTSHAPSGATLAPLSSPKPTQFRFYAAADETGRPVERAAPKNNGYAPGTGLRGRKAYWHPSTTPDGYWTPGPTAAGGRFREWQAPPLAKPSQTATHLGWVRPDAEFTVRLFLDAVPASELAPLLWLATQDGCALRIGGGKPLGFGAVRVSIDWPATDLRTGEALRGSWLSLHRPQSSPREQAEALSAEFGAAATSNPVLAPAIDAWRKVAAGLESPACYPRTQSEPEAETYRWFVANEHIRDGKAEYGFALPHVLDDDQRLPHLPPSRD